LVPENGGFTPNQWQFLQRENDDQPVDLGSKLPWLSSNTFFVESSLQKMRQIANEVKPPDLDPDSIKKQL